MDDSSLTERIKAYTEAFIVGVGLLYATGYLTTLTFLERFGLHDSGTEFLRLKYIYIGILYFLFPVTIAMPAVALVSLKRKALRVTKPGAETDNTIHKQSSTPSESLPKVPLASVLLIMNMLFVFYVVMAFAPPGYVHRREWIVPLMVLVSFGGAMLIRTLEDFKRTARFFERIGGWARWSIFWIVVLVLDRYAMRGLWADLNRMFWGTSLFPTGGLFYFAFVLSYLIIAQRFHIRIHQHPSSKKSYTAIGVGVLFSLFFFSILSFANRVYPFIAAAKGGGDYQKSEIVVVHFLQKPEANQPQKILDLTEERMQTVPMREIEETSSTIYLALTGKEDQWRLRRDLPQVFGIARDSISAIEHSPPFGRGEGPSQKRKKN